MFSVQMQSTDVSISARCNSAVYLNVPYFVQKKTMLLLCKHLSTALPWEGKCLLISPVAHGIKKIWNSTWQLSEPHHC